MAQKIAMLGSVHPAGSRDPEELLRLHPHIIKEDKGGEWTAFSFSPYFPNDGFWSTGSDCENAVDNSERVMERYYNSILRDPKELKLANDGIKHAIAWNGRFGPFRGLWSWLFGITPTEYVLCTIGPTEPLRRRYQSLHYEEGPGRWFNLSKIWELIRDYKNTHKGKPGKIVIEPIVMDLSGWNGDYGDLCKIFAQEYGLVFGYDEKEVLSWSKSDCEQFMEYVKTSLDESRPDDIRGNFGFLAEKEGPLWLSYTER
jgi:hypothetical protein